MNKTIALIGFMGASKSTSGSVLAQRLGLPFSDTDGMVEEATRTPIPELFARWGEEGFRALEEAAARHALRNGGVVALGGGAVLSENTRDLLKDALCVWLQVSPETALERLKQADRPLLAGKDVSSTAALLEGRLPLYQACADMRVDTQGRTPEEIAKAICLLLKKNKKADLHEENT